MACDDEAGRRATVQPDERELDGYDWNLLAVTGIAIECVVLGWLLLWEKPSAIFLS